MHDYLRGCVSRLKTPLEKNVKSTWQSVNLINLFHVGSRSFCITQCLSLSNLKYTSLCIALKILKKIILCQFDFNMNRNRRNIVNDTYISDSISKYIYGNKANHLVRFNYLSPTQLLRSKLFLMCISIYKSNFLAKVCVQKITFLLNSILTFLF